MVCSDGQEFTFRARSDFRCSARRVRASNPKRTHWKWYEQTFDLGRRRRLHWLVLLHWGITSPRLESTVAALAFNRVAQESFEEHDCAARHARKGATLCSRGASGAKTAIILALSQIPAQAR